MDEFLDALSSDNTANAVEYIKSMMNDKAYSYIDQQRSAVAKSMLGDVVGSDDTDEVEIDDEDVNPETEDESPEEQEDETNYGDD